MFNFTDYRDLQLQHFKEVAAREGGDDIGYAMDGPINPDNWDNQKPKLLFLAKETHGFMGCPPIFFEKEKAGYNASPFDRAISKISYLISKTKLTIIKRNEFNHISKEEMQEGFTKLAQIECKKTSTGDEITSGDAKIRDQARLDSSFLKTQIEMLNPDIIVCCGIITWHILKDDCHFFNNVAINLDNSQGIKYIDGKIILNGEHPSKPGYNFYENYCLIADAWIKKING